VAKSWTQVKDVRAFLAQVGKRSSAPHNASKRVLHWAMCSRCGLVWLKNEATRKALAKPCVVEE
jgi:hypothetical protein